MIDTSARKGCFMSESRPPRVKTCDVCIVGAGVAGLNALFAALATSAFASATFPRISVVTR